MYVSVRLCLRINQTICVCEYVIVSMGVCVGFRDGESGPYANLSPAAAPSPLDVRHSTALCCQPEGTHL